MNVFLPFYTNNLLLINRVRIMCGEIFLANVMSLL